MVMKRRRRPQDTNLLARLAVFQLFQGKKDVEVRLSFLRSRAAKARGDDKVAPNSLKVHLGRLIEQGVIKARVDPKKISDPFFRIVNPTEANFLAHDVGEFFQRNLNARTSGNQSNQIGEVFTLAMFSNIQPETLREQFDQGDVDQMTMIQHRVFGMLWVAATKLALKKIAPNPDLSKLIEKAETHLFKLSREAAAELVPSIVKQTVVALVEDENLCDMVVERELEQFRKSSRANWITIHEYVYSQPTVILSQTEADIVQLVPDRLISLLVWTYATNITALLMRQTEKILATSTNVVECERGLKTLFSGFSNITNEITNLVKSETCSAISILYQERNSLGILFVTGNVGRISIGLEEQFIPSSSGWREVLIPYESKKMISDFTNALGRSYLPSIADLLALDARSKRILEQNVDRLANT